MGELGGDECLMVVLGLRRAKPKRGRVHARTVEVGCDASRTAGEQGSRAVRILVVKTNSKVKNS